jgi:16S rRNA (guanine(966)-N(2))-methyltransferase RsmD
MYAGSGQLGIEALSRGADSCVLIEKNPDAVAVIRRNLMAVARREPLLLKNATVLNTDSLVYINRTNERFDVALIDPPYAQGLLEPSLKAVVPRMNPGGIIVCESDANAQLPDSVGGFSLARMYQYGRVLIWLYRWSKKEYDEEDGRNTNENSGLSR